MLKVKKLNKYYYNIGRHPLHVINNTTLEIPETGIIAVIGESGAGKTTLINTVSGLDSFRNGTISFDDTSMSHYRTHVADKLRMKNYGFIFQNYYLLESETVYENVKISLDAFDISEAEKKKRILYVLNQLGIAKYAFKSVTSLSGGEQQRVSIARALVKSPRIIFADEPTGSLDEKTTFNVLNILKKISKTCAVFIVTHERDIISYYADYILELDQGVVVKEFKPSIEEGKRLAIDQNIYLSELEHVKSSTDENVTFDLYTDHSVNDANQIKVAIKNNKIYLEANADITVLGPKTENHLVDGKPLEIKDYVDHDFEYELPALNYSNNKISLKKTLARGYKNYQSKRPIKRIFKVVCALLSVVLMTLVEQMATVRNADLSDSLTASRGNLYLEVLPNDDEMTTAKLNTARQKICKVVDESSLPGEIVFEARDTLMYQYQGFYQVESKKYVVPNHDYKNIDIFDESTLVYGRMPESNYDIIVDEYLLEKFINSTLLNQVVTDYGHFVDKEFLSSYTGVNYKVCGICRTKCPTIYGDISVNFSRLSYETRLRIIDIDYAKKLYPTVFGSLNVEVGHYLGNEAFTSKDYLYSLLHKDASFTESVPIDAVINKKDYEFLKEYASTQSNYMILSCDGNDSNVRALTNLMNQTQKELNDAGIGVKINVVHKYKEEYDKVMGTLENILLILKIAAVVVVIVAVILIIISTYLSMLSQITDIAVYRSLGYSRLNLGVSYFIELLLITLKYIFIGGAATFVTMFILDVAPIIEFTMATPFWEFLVLLLAASGAIIIIGLIPILIVFRRTPANLYNRYNKHLNS